MKTSVKIIILAAALAVVVWSIMFFFKTISTPPYSTLITGQHVADINSGIEGIDGDISSESLEKTFLSTDSKIALWNENTLISNSEHDGCITAFMESYIPAYVSKTKSLLSNKTWGRSDRDDILSRIVCLRAEKFADGGGQVVTSGSVLSDKLKELSQICDDYSNALSLLQNTAFQNVADAKTRIRKARGYADDPYIGHSDLKSDLNGFPMKLGDAHYRKLTTLLSQLSNWRYESLATTKSNYEKFKTACDEYRNTDIYGGDHPKSVTDMKNEAKGYMDYAYDEKCDLYVDNKSSNMSCTFSASGGNYTFDVRTNHPDGYTITLPSFCSRQSKNNSSFSVRCSENTSSSSRSGDIIVRAGNKTINVHVTQKANEKESVSINSVDVDYNVSEGGVKGMRINVNFSASNLTGNGIRVCAWFYFENGNVLKDFNNQYSTSDGQVTVQKRITSTSSYQTVSLFMPYSELHMNSGKYDLKFLVGINDNNSKRLATSSYTSFQFTK